MVGFNYAELAALEEPVREKQPRPRTARGKILDAVTAFWIALYAGWLLLYLYQLIDSRMMVNAIEQALGRQLEVDDGVLNSAIREGEYAGEEYNIAPDDFLVFVAGILYYPPAAVLVLISLVRRTSLRIRMVIAMVALVLVHVAVRFIFSFEAAAITRLFI